MARKTITIDTDEFARVIANSVETVMGEYGLCFYDYRGKEVYGNRPWANPDKVRAEIGEHALKELLFEAGLVDEES